jgi:hypothetical protein
MTEGERETQHKSNPADRALRVLRIVLGILVHRAVRCNHHAGTVIVMQAVREFWRSTSMSINSKEYEAWLPPNRNSRIPADLLSRRHTKPENAGRHRVRG